MKKVLFLIGPHASGKTYTSKEYINENQDCQMIDTGPIMRKIHNQYSKETTMGEWVKNLEEIYGKNITSHIISTEIEKIINNSECNNYILIGFRTLSGIKYAINHLNIEDYSILYIDASLELLHSNYLKRENKNISQEEFNKYINDELNSGLRELKELAANENSTIEYYYRTSNNDSLKGKISMHFESIKCRKRVKEKK